MSFWKRRKQAHSLADAGRVQKAKKTIKRSPPVAMEVKILALEALDSGLSAIEVGELVGDLRRRIAWLDEYFVWKETSAEFYCPVPRRALRFEQQKSWFLDRLRGHVLMVREGPFCEWITEGLSADARNGSRALAAVEARPRRFPSRRLPSLARLLWNSDPPVAWIDETGRRPCNIAERALALRWAPAGPLPGR